MIRRTNGPRIILAARIRRRGTHHHLAADLDPQDEGAQHHSVADQNGRGEVTTHDPVAAQDSGRMWVLGDLPAGQQDDGWDEVEWY